MISDIPGRSAENETSFSMATTEFSSGSLWDCHKQAYLRETPESPQLYKSASCGQFLDNDSQALLRV